MLEETNQQFHNLMDKIWHFLTLINKWENKARHIKLTDLKIESEPTSPSRVQKVNNLYLGLEKTIKQSKGNKVPLHTLKKTLLNSLQYNTVHKV